MNKSQNGPPSTDRVYRKVFDSSCLNGSIGFSYVHSDIRNRLSAETSKKYTKLV